MALGKMRPWGPKTDSVEAKTCRGKTRWKSEEGAQRAISRIRRENPSAIDSTVRPYRCPICRKWHVGHGW